ncbi:MAG: 50S ribosomal protein L19 [Candidatus Levybacteria bacterium GW2011_GWC1_40_19]|nr:MAG: 50S ribosomal protein L19 [Candidatus Levybacteria bacterium GW2011_GWC1_40_19]
MLKTIDFVAGDTVRVSQKIKDGDKTRIQVFEGVVLQIRGRGENKMFTVPKKTPRRARLFHLRNTN